MSKSTVKSSYKTITSTIKNGALRIYLARYASFKRLRDVAAQKR
ncbi:Uncharacterised protein [Vibrio cholerae]|nr:Uncharacterised protein [Vibrio cholerae]